MRQLAQDGALVEIVRALRARQIDHLLLKGAAFARWLYDDPARRSYGDIDLLVPPEAFSAASAVLRDLGFRPDPVGRGENERVDHHDGWVRSGPMAIRLELHRTLAFVSAPRSLLWSRLSADRAAITVAGTPIAVPGEAASTLVVALHAAQHGAGAPGPMEDLERALALVELETWERAAALARELSAEDLFSSGLRLTPPGRVVAERLGLATAASPLVRLRSATPPSTAVGIDRFKTTIGPRARLRLLGSELVPSPVFMRHWQPVARRGRWGLALAYAWRPFWLLTKLPRGWRAWRRASTPGSR